MSGEPSRLQFPHQVASIILVPLMTAFIGLAIYIWNGQTDALVKIQTGNDKIIAALSENQRDVAVNGQRIFEHDRRLASIESWRDAFTGFNRPTPPNYEKN